MPPRPYSLAPRFKLGAVWNLREEDRPRLGPFANLTGMRENEVHVTQLIVTGDGQLLNRRDRAQRGPSYTISRSTTVYDPVQKARTTQVEMKIAHFRDVEPARPSLISKARQVLGKFFTNLIGRNGGTEQEVPKPEENVEQVDQTLEHIKMPQVEVIDKRKPINSTTTLNRYSHRLGTFPVQRLVSQQAPRVVETITP